VEGVALSELLDCLAFRFLAIVQIEQRLGSGR
jgi:hypothetical protein